MTKIETHGRKNHMTDKPQKNRIREIIETNITTANKQIERPEKDNRMGCQIYSIK